MKKALKVISSIFIFTASSWAAAEVEYVTIAMEIDINAPAEETWSKVGEYCDISEWFNLECEITEGNGEMGTLRSLMGGRVTEVLIAKTDLSYGYTIPQTEGQFYNLYHGFLEAKPITESTSKIMYTLFYDVSDKANQEAKDADIASRRTMFEGALQKMKKIIEAN